MSTTTEAPRPHAAPVYYFGCLGQTGHFLHDPDGRHARRAPEGFPHEWGADWMPGAGLDGKLLDKKRGQTEGSARLHHVHGWTALAFWDRSVDSRYGSNSVFVTRGTLGFSAMLGSARAAWPAVFARFTFDIVEDADAQRAA